jgi:hypothetical protein
MGAKPLPWEARCQPPPPPASGLVPVSRQVSMGATMSAAAALLSALRTAQAQGQLSAAAVGQGERVAPARAPCPPPPLESLADLIARGAWAELEDRFYKGIAFGTGGMRGRTVGRVSAANELGRRRHPGPGGRGLRLPERYQRAPRGSRSLAPRRRRAPVPADRGRPRRPPFLPALRRASWPPPGRSSAARPTSSPARVPRRSSSFTVRHLGRPGRRGHHGQP